MTIIYWAVGWLGGIWLGSLLDLPTPLWVVLGVLGMVLSFVLHRYPFPIALFIVLSAVALGAARYNLSRTVIDQNHIAYFNGVDQVVVRGLVIKAPDIHETYQNLTVESESISVADSRQRPVTGTSL